MDLKLQSSMLNCLCGGCSKRNIIHILFIFDDNDRKESVLSKAQLYFLTLFSKMNFYLGNNPLYSMRVLFWFSDSYYKNFA